MRSDDIAALIADTESRGDLGFHQGLVLEWNADTGANTISVDGKPLVDLPLLTSAGLVALRKGDTVGILRVKSTLFILARIVAPGSSLVQPQWPIVLYPQFSPNTPIDTGGYATISAGKLVTWEGRIRASHPKIDVDGIWGVATGTGSVTFALKLGGTTVGSWTMTGFQVQKASILAGLTTGGFDVTEYIGQDWLKIEVAITASSGTGVMAFQILGAYFRQS